VKHELNRSKKMGVLAFTDYQELMHKMVAEDESHNLVVPVDADWNTKVVRTWELASQHEETDEEGNCCHWHLHPEFVDRDAETGKWSTMLCPNCDNSVKAKKIPSLSIAGGIDFGYYKRLGLEEPNLQEQLILSRTRLCHAVLKASSNKHGASKDFDSRSLAQIHAIIFPHNAPEVATHLYNPNIFKENGLLDLEQLKNQLSICFVTDKGSHDSLVNVVFGSSRILARPLVIAQWLLVLKATKKSYKDLDLQNVTKDRVTAVLDKLMTHLEETAETLDAPEVLQFEEQLGSDVAQNQHTDEVDEVVDQ